jgi:hypothetical protein
MALAGNPKGSNNLHGRLVALQCEEREDPML